MTHTKNFVETAKRRGTHTITFAAIDIDLRLVRQRADILLNNQHGEIMRRLLAGLCTCAAALAATFITLPSASDVAPAEGSRVSDAPSAVTFITPPSASDVVPAEGSRVSDTASLSAPSPSLSAPSPSLSEPSPVPACGSEQDGNGPFADEPACTGSTRTPDEIVQARAYLVETASPGYTMTLQGPEIAIGRVHPEFALRLEHAIREARSAGLTSAAIFSAYRPPAFGVGGFHDKFNSLHTYGLAVDMRGIGAPGSSEAQLWHEIAAKNGVVCPYGPRDRAEWNHCQPTGVKMIRPNNPLRETVTAAGPSDLEGMFEAGNSVIEDMASAADSLSRAAPTPVRALEIAAKSVEPKQLVEARQQSKREERAAGERVAAKPAQHAKLERVAAQPSQHAKPERAESKPPQQAKSSRHAQATRAIEDNHRKGKSNRA